MLTKLSLQNFKAFGKRTDIELAPITLIFGENSAGKSSILQSLNLLKQTYDSGQTGAALLPRVEGGFVDLGSYHEMIFDHDTKRKLKIGLHTDSRSTRARSFSATRGSGLEISFRRNARNGEVVVSDLDVTLDGKKKPLARFKIRKAKRDEQKELQRYNTYAAMPGRIRTAGKAAIEYVAECKSVTDDLEYWQSIHDEWFSRRDEIVKFLKFESRRREELIEPGTPTVDRRSTKDVHKEAIEFYSREFEVAEFVERFTNAAIGRAVLMDGFLPQATPLMRMWHQLPELRMVYAAPGAGRRIRKHFDVSSLLTFTGRDISLNLDMMFPMGPFRRPPERWYIFTGTSPVDVGYKGDHLPDLLYQKPELIKKANSWLSKLDIGYQLRVRAVGDRKNSDLFELRLVDSRRGKEVEVALSDVGFGISQILPFLVQSLSSENRIISIEQPEVHIHPRLQADLGDLIAEGIKKPHFHQYLIETHSEHLILRVQKLVRTKVLKPHDVSVLYVSRDVDGSKIERLRLDKQGDFVDDWPGGFFSERLRELV